MKYVDMDNVQWQLFKVVGLESLTRLARFSDHDVVSFKQILETVKKLSDSELYPTLREMDAAPARFEDGSVVVHPVVGTTMKTLGEMGMIGAPLDYDDGGLQLPMTLFQALNYVIDAANNHVSGYSNLTFGAAELVAVFGSQQLKVDYLPKM
ncbi:MAG: acyl-CoA dehydrogenase family protein, partial [Vulcanimicrobiota bacterium]